MRIPAHAIEDLVWLAQLGHWPGYTLTMEQALQAMQTLVKADNARLRQSVDSLVQLVAVGRARNLTRAEVIASLGHGLRGADMPNGGLGNLVRWLDFPALQLKGKALALLGDCQRTVLDTRVLQDVRPVFGDEEPPEAQAMLVVHTLRLSYIEDGEVRHREFGLTLADVRKLEVQCARAARQDAALGKLAANSGVPVLDPMQPLEER